GGYGSVACFSSPRSVTHPVAANGGKPGPVCPVLAGTAPTPDAWGVTPRVLPGALALGGGSPAPTRERGGVGVLALPMRVQPRLRDRPCPHGRSDPLHRARAHVANREHAGQTGFQRKRRRLARLGPVLAWQVSAGQDEPVLVARDIIGQPVGVRGGAD